MRLPQWNKHATMVSLILLASLSLYVGYRLKTDEGFLSTLRYKFYGWQAAPDIFSIINYGDSLYVPYWQHQQEEFIKVGWNGDTLERRSFIGTIDYLGLPASAYTFSGYDSEVIRIRPLRYSEYQVVAVGLGTSKLTITRRGFDGLRVDTTQLRVLQRGDRLVIEGNKIVRDPRLTPNK